MSDSLPQSTRVVEAISMSIYPVKTLVSLGTIPPWPGGGIIASLSVDVLLLLQGAVVHLARLLNL